MKVPVRAAAPVDAALMDALADLLASAAAAIRTLATTAFAVAEKADRSPVTEADHAADAIIGAGLARLMPGVAVVSEERAPGPDWRRPDLFVLVDPLDGTREFCARREDYSVNLAIIADGYPIAGLIALPAAGRLYRGVVEHGAERLAIDFAGAAPTLGLPVAIKTRPAPAAGLVAAVSRSHFDARSEAWLAGLPVAERRTCGSAMKFCLLAEGAVDVYPRLGPTCEWDIAAGHALVAAAGGTMTDGHGRPLTYGHAGAGFAVADFLAWGDPAARPGA